MCCPKSVTHAEYLAIFHVPVGLRPSQYLGQVSYVLKNALAWALESVSLAVTLKESGPPTPVSPFPEDDGVDQSQSRGVWSFLPAPLRSPSEGRIWKRQPQNWNTLAFDNVIVDPTSNRVYVSLHSSVELSILQEFVASKNIAYITFGIENGNYCTYACQT